MRPLQTRAPVLLLALAACGTIGSPGGGAENLPSSGAGPFQGVDTMQLAPQHLAPFVLRNIGHSYLEPSVLPATGDPSSTQVLLYVVEGSAIIRTRADDAVSFYGDSADVQTNPTHKPPIVLSASLEWEGQSVSGPSALRVGSEIWLYYAAAQGIGLAKSSDGRSFTKTGQPVLGLDQASRWEFTAPRAPSVAVFPDGTWHMIYASGNDLGEATSSDGVKWERVDGDPSTPALDPVLAPSAVVDPSTLGEGEHPPFDEGAVDDPLLVPRVDPTGQLQVRVFYAGYDKPLGEPSRTAAIGFAARYGDSGALSRQAQAVYTAPQSSANAPTLLEWSGTALLYVSQVDITGMPTFNAIAAAYDPTAGSPTAPGKFPSAP
jgi:hypothetical protein